MRDQHLIHNNLTSDAIVSPLVPTALLLRKALTAAEIQLPELRPHVTENEFRVLFSGLKRRFGEGALSFSPEQAALLAATGFLSASIRPVHILGRVVLLLELSLQRQQEEMAILVHNLFIRGDNMEQCAILCALPLLPSPEQYVNTATQATRGYVLEVFDTLINRNPYPALYFNDNTFNQAILKALFLGIPLQDVNGLNTRITPELKRMVSAFVSERRVAGRDVPADIALII